MAGQQKLDEAKSAIGVLTNVNIQVLANVTDDTARKARRLQMEASVGRTFHRYCKDALERCVESIDYSPDYPPEHHEVLHVDLSEAANAHIKDIITLAERIGQNQILVETDGFLDGVSCYSITTESTVANDTRRIIFFRKFQHRWQPNMRNKLVMKAFGTRFKKVESNLFSFDNKIDFFVYGDDLFVIHKSNFEAVFQYYERLRAKADTIIASILAVVPIANSQEFADTCRSNIKMIAKLLQISERPDFNAINVADLMQRIQEDGIDIQIDQSSGADKLVFDRTMGKQWKILGLLDEKILISTRTQQKYLTGPKKILR